MLTVYCPYQLQNCCRTGLRRELPTIPKMLLFTRHAKVVGATRAASSSTSHGDGRGVGAVVVDVGPDQHQALRHAERKAQTYGKALVGLASLCSASPCAPASHPRR